MLAVVLAFALATTYAAELPSYINVCGRYNPNLNQCIKDNIDNLKDKICNGLVEINLPALEPIIAKKLVVSDTDNSQVYFKNIKITGLCDYVLNYVSINLGDSITFEFDVTFNQLLLNGTYNIDLRILVPITYNSPTYFVAPNVHVNGLLRMSMVTKKGKKYVYGSEIKTKIKAKEYKAKYDLKEEERNQLKEIIGDLIDNNQQEFLDKIVPQLEQVISEWLLSNVNSVFKNFSYDTLLPERE